MWLDVKKKFEVFLVVMKEFFFLMKNISEICFVWFMIYFFLIYDIKF